MKVASEHVTLQTEPIHKYLAKLVNDLMFKVKIDTKHGRTCERIKRPENCESFVCTKINELIWNRLQVSTTWLVFLMFNKLMMGICKV